MRQSNDQGALQQPVGSGFNAKSTAAEVMEGINLSGKTAIVTGGNTGIGLETTKRLAEAGASVIVLARDVEKAKQNLAGINGVTIAAMDFMAPDSIDAFAAKFIASAKPLHLLINNAGIMWVPLRRDARGIEAQLATNYLGQYHLTAKLFPALKKANGARVINLSSLGHQFGDFNFEDPNFLHREYETLQAYGQSKTATNLFSLQLDHLAKAFKVRAYAVHPGSIGGTELAREASLEEFQKLGYLDADGNMKPEVAAQLKTIPQGAATSVWCATSPLLDNIGGVYCEDVEVAKLATGDSVESSGVKAYSLDEHRAKKLWQLSEELAGAYFEF
ncbi:SDR family NAD(P)-dependent oxidoreductase [Pedobacter sp. KR3-3]|uniref:SDR family NAD(P)-dependent oxidoreductase n=1 Tax=Pedobacter albus TaxID=3113905 RepID=A0ABU7I400_9SPHI|nr:SDR family NAD(P)-dependent oxidoreductase [Pedobacter sp. KR3-3]MEE1944051.1 SDR family NAD(P)-dependent oxidoreductase [Pedobacter sp. KR3-3]